MEELERMSAQKVNGDWMDFGGSLLSEEKRRKQKEMAKRYAGAKSKASFD